MKVKENVWSYAWHSYFPRYSRSSFPSFKWVYINWLMTNFRGLFFFSLYWFFFCYTKRVEYGGFFYPAKWMFFLPIIWQLWFIKADLIIICINWQLLAKYQNQHEMTLSLSLTVKISYQLSCLWSACSWNSFNCYIPVSKESVSDWIFVRSLYWTNGFSQYCCFWKVNYWLEAIIAGKFRTHFWKQTTHKWCWILKVIQWRMIKTLDFKSSNFAISSWLWFLFGFLKNFLFVLFPIRGY